MGSESEVLGHRPVGRPAQLYASSPQVAPGIRFERASEPSFVTVAIFSSLAFFQRPERCALLPPPSYPLFCAQGGMRVSLTGRLINILL
jgi:hypothetical protein